MSNQDETWDLPWAQALGGGPIQVPAAATASYPTLIGNGMLALDAYDSNEMVDLDGFQFEDMERNLDFIRFVEQWYYRARLNEGEFPILCDEAKMIRNWTRPKHITRQDLNGDRCDIQGIDWTKIGVMRETAQRVRSDTYYNYTNVKPRSTERPPTQAANSENGNFFEFRRMDATSVAHLSHFQLRNLMCCASNSDLIFAGRSEIYHTNPITDTTRVVMDFSKPSIDSAYYAGGWKTSTLTATLGVLIVGSFRGEYAMASLNATFGAKHVEGIVTTDENAITNYVHTYVNRHSSNPVAAFCSNDKKIRTLDCYTNTFIHEHQYDWPVNCAATSPDGRLRVVVGDDLNTTIGDAETGRTLCTLQGHEDYGFACDWADDGFHVATGNQDKQVRVYDARNWSEPLKVLHTERAGARGLRFSPVGGGRRVLLVAEPADLLHVIDATHFESQQRFDMFGEIAGISFSPDGHHFYAANADERFGGIIQYGRTGYGEDVSGHDQSDDDSCGDLDWLSEDDLDSDGRIKSSEHWRKRNGLDLSQLII